MYLLFIKRLFLILFILTSYIQAQSTQSVSIQLKWKHSFQFAGYYAALEKGFYKEEGLDVTLKEIDPSRNFISDVANGFPEYGVSDSSLAISYIKGYPVVLVAQIFQHSPLVLISHKDSNITSPYDFIGKKVMYSFKYTGAIPFQALILNTLGSFDNINIQNFSKYQDFIDKKVDVASAYSTSQPYWLKKKGVEINIIDPKSYGIDMYGDNFFTSKKELKEHPIRVAKMKRATIKGWAYALSHQEEIINLIIQKYAPNKEKDILIFEAKGIRGMIKPKLFEIGQINKKRYQEVIEIYNKLGLINKKNIDDNFFFNNSNKIHYSHKEKLWLKNNPMIRIAIMKYWKYDKNGNNIHTDILKLLNKYGHIGIKPIKLDTWAEGFNQATLGKSIHGITNLSWSKERKEKNFYFTKPYNFSPSYLIVKQNSTIKSLDDLENKTILLKKDSINNKIIENKKKNIKIITVNTDDEMYQKLANNDNISAFMSYTVNNAQLIKYNLKIATTIYGKYSQIHIGLSKNNPELYSIIDKIYNIIPRKEIIALQNKIYQYEVLKLTKEEQAWINNHKQITFIADPMWQPFEFIDKQTNKHSGIASDYLKLISKKTGLLFKMSDIRSWQEGMKKIDEKKSDFYPCISQNNQRSKFMNFSSTYLEYPIVMVTQNNKDFLSDLNELNNKIVVAVRGYSTSKILKENYPEINLIYVNNIKEALEKVSTGDAYAYVSMLPSASYAINKYNFFNLKIAGKTKYTLKLKMAMNKNLGKTGIEIINKALKSITKEEKAAIYNKWISIKFEKSVDYTKIWQLSFVFLFFIIGTLYWNRKLSIEIQKRKQREEELEVANKKAKEATKSKSEFLANMSHEIRTPMNSIIGFSELLSKMIKDPIQKNYLDSIQTGGKALMAIINDILDLSKIEAGKFKIEKEDINPVNLFNEMHAMFNAKINQKNLSFIIDIDKNLPNIIIIDSVRVRQILLNIIGNAIKFTNTGSITLKVQNEFTNNENTKLNLKISVIDTGRGIPQEFQEKIFQAFEQTSADDAKVFAGTGLGLAICSKLVKLMHGTIKVHSEVQKGSEFIINLYDIKVGSSIKENKEEELVKIKFHKANILVVDDVLENRKLVTATLANESFFFIEAHNGQEALEIMKDTSNSIDLILMDLRMPIMNGYESTIKIKEFSNTPIIAFTASVMSKDLDQIKEHGFDGYIRKPVIYNDLVKELKNHLEYNIIKEDDKEKEFIITDHKIINNIPNILNLLKGEFRIRLNDVKDKGDFSLIKDLMEDIKNTAKNNYLDTLEKYTNNILLSIESFDIEKVSILINNYDKEINKLEKIYEDNKNA